jgi:hypothetical protein
MACGSPKRFITNPCPTCGFSPLGDPAAVAKSVYLSVNRFDDFDEQTRWSGELEAIGQQIGRHQSFEFDPAELARMSERVEAFQSVSRGQVYGALFRCFLPALCFFVAVGLVAALLRHFGGH